MNTKNENNKFIQLGTCRKPHGIKGGFVFNLINTDDSVLKKSSKILIKSLGQSFTDKEYQIKQISFGNKIICYLKGIENRNQVEELIPFDIFIDKDLLPDLDEDEVYLSDLIGFKVIDQENNDLIGTLINFSYNGSHDILEIKLNSEEELLIPYIDQFVKEIDLNNKTISVVTPQIV